MRRIVRILLLLASAIAAIGILWMMAFPDNLRELKIATPWFEVEFASALRRGGVMWDWPRLSTWKVEARSISTAIVPVHPVLQDDLRLSRMDIEFPPRDYFLFRTNGFRTLKAIGVPLWLPLMFCALPWGWLVYKKVRRRRSDMTGLCPNCSYDLRAHAAGAKCPECGTVISVVP